MVRKLVLPISLAMLLLIGFLAGIQTARGQGPDGQPSLKHETQGENVREAEAPSQAVDPAQPNIGFIDSPSSTCYQPDPSRDECFLNWYYLSVDASPNYMIAMTVTINSIGPVANVVGFFQTSMYTPYNMFGNGYKVACGSLGAGGYPGLGNAYAWTVRAQDSAGLKSANYGTAKCPAYIP